MVSSLRLAGMATIRTILDHFGFSVRELAQGLGLSHSQMLNVEKNRRKAPPHLCQTLDHPLFASYDFSFSPEPETDPAELPWLRAQLAIAKCKLLDAKAQWTALQKKQVGVYRILHHTRHLEEFPVSEKDLITDWWRLQRSKALLWLQLRKPLAEWELERKIVLLEQDVAWLRTKISEAEA